MAARTFPHHYRVRLPVPRKLFRRDAGRPENTVKRQRDGWSGDRVIQETRCYIVVGATSSFHFGVSVPLALLCEEMQWPKGLGRADQHALRKEE